MSSITSAQLAGQAAVVAKRAATWVEEILGGSAGQLNYAATETAGRFVAAIQERLDLIETWDGGVPQRIAESDLVARHAARDGAEDMRRRCLAAVQDCVVEAPTNAQDEMLTRFEHAVREVEPAPVKSLQKRIDAAVIWHESAEKALSKQPQTGETPWRRNEHREQIALLRGEES